MKQIDVSVIIPTYKPEFWLQECIVSVSKQNYNKEKFEIIIILNGDLSYCQFVQNLIDKYLKGLNVTFLKTTLAGVSNARNMGIDNSKGEYICFIDDDDIISDNYIAQLKKVSSKTCLGVSPSFYFIDSIENSFKNSFILKKEAAFKKSYNSFYYRKCLSGVNGKMIHKAIIEEERFDNRITLGEDNVFWLTIVHNIKDMKIIDKCSYYIRQREESAQHRHYDRKYLYKQMRIKIIKIIQLYFTHIRNHNFLLFLSKLRTTIIGSFRMMSIKS